MTTETRDCRSSKFALDLNTESENLTEVNKIATQIGHCTCAAGLAEVNAHLSGAARVNTPPCRLPLTTAAPPSCKPVIIQFTKGLCISYNIF